MSSVLLAEDEFLIRAVLVDALGDAGLTCIEAATGQAALDVVTGDAPSRRSSSISACPTCRARRVIEAAVRHRPGLPIIQCSGSHLRPPDVAGQKIHVFPKPYNAEELSKFVAALVRGTG